MLGGDVYLGSEDKEIDVEHKFCKTDRLYTKIVGDVAQW